MQITLRRHQLERLDEFVTRLQRHWRARGVKNRRINREADLSVDRRGTYGEYAACLLLGMQFDWTVGAVDGHIDGARDGKSVQIKTTKPNGRYLVFYSLEHFVADYAVLAWLDEPTDTVRLVGWTDRETFKRQHTMHRFTVDTRSRPVMPREELYPMASIFPEVTRVTLNDGTIWLGE